MAIVQPVKLVYDEHGEVIAISEMVPGDMIQKSYLTQGMDVDGGSMTDNFRSLDENVDGGVFSDAYASDDVVFDSGPLNNGLQQ
jgi:hypothetical protein